MNDTRSNQHTPDAPGTPDSPAAPRTADAAGGTRPADTGAHTEAAAAAITTTRSRIDELDERIIALVRERTAASAAVQQSRIASGGRRVNLSRETQIVGRYTRELGRPGTTLAMTLLELGRGRI
ncbi:chorismate mutase [Streptomyces sp. NPDC050560]|uniref:chorismate mutase n=1 Tax=Streptomyces sp. NPDC050560 TaxID=3365630 RepID=UPI0037B53B8C